MGLISQQRFYHLLVISLMDESPSKSAMLAECENAGMGHKIHLTKDGEVTLNKKLLARSSVCILYGL